MEEAGSRSSEKNSSRSVQLYVFSVYQLVRVVLFCANVHCIPVAMVLVEAVNMYGFVQ